MALQVVVRTLPDANDQVTEKAVKDLSQNPSFAAEARKMNSSPLNRSSDECRRKVRQGPGSFNLFGADAASATYFEDVLTTSISTTNDEGRPPLALLCHWLASRAGQQ